MFGELCELCIERISRLKGLCSAWESFCDGLGVSAEDIDTMIALPLIGPGDVAQLIEEILGEVLPDEDYRRECLEHMTELWNTKIRDCHP